MNLKTISVLSIVTVLAGLHAGVAVAEEAELSPDRLLIDSESLKLEQSDHDLLMAFAEKNGRLLGRDLSEITLRSGALRALEENLSVQKKRRQEAISEAALLEARALFDPVLTASINHAASETVDRIERPKKYKKATTHLNVGEDTGVDEYDGNGNLNTNVNCTDNPSISTQDEGIGTTADDTAGCEVITFAEGPVAYTDFDEPRSAGFHKTKVIASDAGRQKLTGPDETNVLTLGLQQALPWGSDLALTLDITHKEAYFFVNEEALRAGGAKHGSYDRPWTSSLSLGATVPLPFTKDFGKYGAREMNLLLQTIDKERSRLEVEKMINDTLLSVDLAYWRLVGAQNDLLALFSSEKVAERLVVRAERLFNHREISAYDFAQAKAELHRIREQEEQSWNTLLQASHALVDLLNIDDDKMILLPSGYRVLIDNGDDDSNNSSPGPTDSMETEEPSYAEAVAMNPTIKTLVMTNRSLDLDIEGRKNQARLDIKMTANLQYSQSNQVFGYADIGKSISKLNKPDTIRQTYGIQFHRPWGNRLLKAGLRTAVLNREIGALRLDKEKNDLAWRIENARVQLESARKRRDITKRHIELTELALEKALKRQERRAVTEYEIVLKNSEALQARRNHFRAQIHQKEAEARLMAAHGLLARHYGEHTAQTRIDRHRLARLARKHAFRFLGASDS